MTQNQVIPTPLANGAMLKDYIFFYNQSDILHQTEKSADDNFLFILY